ncbi:TPA: hypothetical protein HA278_05060 [Candidatus Woesearchaeota archaeon]|nr:hypothetical protein [Candidatus Woesearchaeota archaeon]|tara:strand:+ start:1204 stop:1377 length:174 start_codon:yes stop_codon:yes gene_type:complete
MKKYELPLEYQIAQEVYARRKEPDNEIKPLKIAPPCYVLNANGNLVPPPEETYLKRP